jgi:hypothetical protein
MGEAGNEHFNTKLKLHGVPDSYCLTYCPCLESYCRHVRSPRVPLNTFPVPGTLVPEPISMPSVLPTLQPRKFVEQHVTSRLKIWLLDPDESAVANRP